MKRVKFLDGNEQQHKANMMESLADEYKQRKASLDRNLQKVMRDSRVAHTQVLKKSKEEIEAEQKKREEEQAAQEDSPLARLMGEQVTTPPDEVLADGFVRSKRAQQLRVKDSITNEIHEIGE